MRLSKPSILIVLTPLLTSISAKGINCEGSAACSFVNNKNVASQLVEYISHVDTNRFYNNGEQIACEQVQALESDATICAFLQNTGGASGQAIQNLAHYITDHHCTVCGSVPTGYPGDNNVANGELTFNAVGTGCSKGGLC